MLVGFESLGVAEVASEMLVCVAPRPPQPLLPACLPLLSGVMLEVKARESLRR